MERLALSYNSDGEAFMSNDTGGGYVLYADAQATIAALQARVQELEGVKQRYEQSENAAQLYHRELTRAKNRICEAAGLPPDSGYEPAIKHLQAELERVRDQFADLRKMVAALPKVEGEYLTKEYIEVKVPVLRGTARLSISDELIALLQHRQGMEG